MSTTANVGFEEALWKEVNLEEIVHFSNGKKRPAELGEIPVYGGNGILGYCDQQNSKGESIIIGRVGAYCGNVYFETNPCWISDNAILGKAKAGVPSKFMYYKLIHMNLHSLRIGSSQPLLTQTILKKLNVMIPSLEEQKRIENILSSLDEKIETNKQIIQKQVEIAESIFTQWFVDFEFDNEEGNPYKSSGGKLIDSELGIIPDGWEVRKLNEVVEIKYGKNLATKNLIAEGYPVFGGNGVIGYYDEYLYEDPQVLIACRGAASGKVLNSLPFSFVTNNSLVLENDQSILSFEYLSQYCLLNQYHHLATGSAQPQITIANMSNAVILVPEKKVMTAFSKIFQGIHEEQLILQKEISQLSIIRDTLLPKLMKGEISADLVDFNE